MASHKKKTAPANGRMQTDLVLPAGLTRRSPLALLITLVVGVAIGVAGLAGVQALRTGNKVVSTSQPAKTMVTSYYDLLSMSPDELAKVDLALMNLLCAKGLPDAENLDIPAILKQLDEWAAKVMLETERHLYRVKDPRYAEHYAHSEARLRAEFIVQCLQEDCGVHYNPDRIDAPDWHNSQDLFLHGLVCSTNGGTCSSMPLIYTVIGRRLGYPMKLVLASSHIFCRWDGDNERFNIEGATNGGVDYYPDEYYHTWPKPISEAAIQRGEYLKSLTPVEELSSFLIDRGMCLDENGRYPEARAAFAEAHRLMPQSAYHLRQLAISMRQVFGAARAAKRHRQQEVDAWLQQFMVPEPRPGPAQLPRPPGDPQPVPAGVPRPGEPKRP